MRAGPVSQPSKSSIQLCCRARLVLTLHSLRCSSDVSQEYSDLIRSERGLCNSSDSCALIESFSGSVGKLCCTRHWWDEDVVAFEAELNALKNPVGSLADVDATVSAFLAKKKEGVTATTEVSSMCQC